MIYEGDEGYLSIFWPCRQSQTHFYSTFPCEFAIQTLMFGNGKVIIPVWCYHLVFLQYYTARLQTAALPVYTLWLLCSILIHYPHRKHDIASFFSGPECGAVLLDRRLNVIIAWVEGVKHRLYKPTQHEKRSHQWHNWNHLCENHGCVGPFIKVWMYFAE